MLKIFFAVLLFTSCQWQSSSPSVSKQSPNKTEDSPPSAYREGVAGLSSVYARYRSQQLEKVEYQLELNLTEKEYYAGKSKIKFRLQKPTDLTVDFSSGEIEQIKVNGATREIKYNSFFISLAKEDLAVGDNNVEIQFRHPYGTQSGLIRFVDPKDKKVYVYPSFTGYGINQIWPCFDQPDLLSSIELLVKTPKDWQVFGSFPKGENDYSQGFFYWKFPVLVKVNIQQISIVAGFFKILEKNIPSQKGLLTLRLLARDTQIQKVNAEVLFLAQKNGLHFFEKLFQPVIINHYTLAFVPSTSEEGISLGITVFSENFLQEFGLTDSLLAQQQTQSILENLATVWFGQIVRAAGEEEKAILLGIAKALSYQALKKNTLFADSAEINFSLYRNSLLRKGANAYREEKQVLMASLLTRNLLSRLTADKFIEKLKNFTQKYQSKAVTKKELSVLLESQLILDIKNIDNVLFSKQEFDFECSEKTNSLMFASTQNIQQSSPQAFLFREDGSRVTLYDMAQVDASVSKFFPKEWNQKIQCDRVAFLWMDPYNVYPSLFVASQKQTDLFVKNFIRIEDPELRALAWIQFIESEISSENKLQIITQHLDHEVAINVVFAVSQKIQDLFAKLSDSQKKKWKEKLSHKTKLELKVIKDLQSKKVWKYFLDKVK